MITPAEPWPLAPLMHAFSAEPGRPRLTWYGQDHERIELSGHVLDNWVTKTTNLLVEEFEAGPGTRVLLDLPVHWRAIVWAFATWRCGACVVLPGAAEAGACDVVVTDRPDRYAGAAEVVAVALPALARRFDGSLPRGAVDAAGAVMTYGDVLTYLPEAALGHPALLDATTTRGPVPHTALLSWARDQAGAPPAAQAPRVLVALAPDVLVESPVDPLVDQLVGQPVDHPRAQPVDQPRGTAAVLALALTVYAAGGSLVLCSPDVAVELAADPARRARLVESERITES